MTPRTEPRMAGASAALPLQAQRVLVPALRGSPQCQGESRARPDGVAGLTDAVGRGQQQQEQREHGADAWVPRAGLRVLRLRVPWDPPVVTIRPHSCSGRGPVANRLGSFPRERLFCLSARRRGVLRTAASVPWVGWQLHPGVGTGGCPAGMCPTDPARGSQCPLHRHQVPPGQSHMVFEVSHLHGPTLRSQRPGGDSLRCKIRFYLAGQFMSSGRCPCRGRGVETRWSLRSLPAQSVPCLCDPARGAGGQSGTALGGRTRSGGAGAGPGGCGGSGRICGWSRRSPNPGGAGSPTPWHCRETQAEASGGVCGALHQPPQRGPLSCKPPQNPN